MKRISIPLLLAVLFATGAQAQTITGGVCTIRDTLYKGDGTRFPGARVIVSRVEKANRMISLGPHTYIANASGFVSFTVPQGATCYIFANIAGFNTPPNGAQVSIPDSSGANCTRNLSTLQPASNTISTNAGFVRLREIDGSPIYTITGNDDTLEVTNSTLSSPNPRKFRITIPANGNAHRIRVNDASGVFSEASALTNGQLLIGSTSAAPVAAALTGTSGEITVTPGAGSITLSVPDIYRQLELPAGFFNPKAGDLTGATALADDADNTNDFTIDQLEFSATVENYVSATVNMPEDWDGSTAPKFKIIYYSGTGHGSNTVEWDIQTGWIRPGTDSWIAALGAAVTTNHNPTTANVWYITSALSPTPAGTAATGAQIKIRIFRDGDDAVNDTHTATARLAKVLMQYKKTVYGDITSW